MSLKEVMNFQARARSAGCIWEHLNKPFVLDVPFMELEARTRSVQFLTNAAWRPEAISWKILPIEYRLAAAAANELPAAAAMLLLSPASTPPPPLIGD